MTRGAAVAAFVAFAVAYFLSALLRAVTATLAPVFSAELGLGAADLGLLAGAYFLGFAALQLPLGSALDRHGARRVVVALLLLAVVGCLAFSAADGLAGLIAARTLIGMGVAACLMGPLTHFRHHFRPEAQLRSHSWMLMCGSLGMVASTLPVQWALPWWGWRGLFVALAAGLVVSAAAIAWVVRTPSPGSDGRESGAGDREHAPGYGAVWAHPAFRQVAPVGFFVYGGMIAVQSLWAGPWLTRVAGQAPDQAARGLFAINLCMLVAFLGWGVVMPRLARRGWTADRLLRVALPASLLWLAAMCAWPQPAGAAAWAVWCVLCTGVAPTQPALGQAFAPSLAGRALSAYNLVIFAGVFAIQWGIGVAVDALRALGAGEPLAFRLAFAAFAACSVWSLAHYRRLAATDAVAAPGGR